MLREVDRGALATPRPVVLRLTNNPGSPFHGDLQLELGTIQLTADSYYFELDRRPDEPQGMPAVRASLRALLEQWRVQVMGLEDGASVTLPFDYSDQYTGVMVVTRRGTWLDVVPGFTEVEGWAHYPSDIAGLWERNPKITTEGDAPKVSVERTELVAAIEESARALT